MVREIQDTIGTEYKFSDADIEELIRIAREQSDKLQKLRSALEVRAAPEVIIRLSRELVGLPPTEPEVVKPQ